MIIVILMRRHLPLKLKKVLSANIIPMTPAGNLKSKSFSKASLEENAT
jgi:hypothetical protein